MAGIGLYASPYAGTPAPGQGHFMSFLTTQPLLLAVLIFIVPATLLAMAGPYVVRRYVKLSRLRTNNEVAGFKFATIGVLYAVMLAFAVVVVWEKFNQADGVVASEAASAATVFRLAGGLDPEHGGAISRAVAVYLTAAVSKDWPAMEQGAESTEVTRALNDIYVAVLKPHTSTAGNSVALAAVLQQLDSMSDARRERLVVANGVVPDIIWVMLFVGAAVTIGFTFFFGTDNLFAQSMMTGALAVLIFAGLLTIVAIDHPFAGSVKVGPEALSKVIEDFANTRAP
jgi:hypothetical protein